MASFKDHLEAKYQALRNGKWYLGNFSEFGLRRRLSAEAQELVIEKFSHLNDTMHCVSRFIGTSNVYLAWKYGVTPVGTMAHEWIMCAGQGDLMHNPAYCNWFALDAWVKEYGILNGTALTDTIGTDTFLKDFQLTYATLFSGVRHDSGDPIEWARRWLLTMSPWALTRRRRRCCSLTASTSRGPTRFSVISRAASRWLSALEHICPTTPVWNR